MADTWVVSVGDKEVHGVLYQIVLFRHGNSKETMIGLVMKSSAARSDKSWWGS
jgi:hypothetical protein